MVSRTRRKTRVFLSLSLFFFFLFLNEMKFSTNEDKNGAINDDDENRSFSRMQEDRGKIL